MQSLREREREMDWTDRNEPKWTEIDISGPNGPNRPNGPQ